jgi:hypothetical protein
MKKAFFIAGITGFAVFSLALKTNAATTTVGTASAAMSDNACGITTYDLATIKSIQENSSISPFNELQWELATRRNLLSKTILCAETDAEQIKTDLNNTTVDPSLENLRNQWSDHLNDAISYYNIELQRVNEAGISGTESIAQEVLAWRESTYVPLEENVSNFIAWSKNQALFMTAEGRLVQINNLVSSPLFSESPDVQNDYEDAAVSLKAAEDQNASVKNAFAESLSPDQTLLFIKQSLGSLSSTYQYFFNISNLVQSLLPH